MRATGVFPQMSDDVTLWRPEDFYDSEFAQAQIKPWWQFARGWLIWSMVVGIAIGLFGHTLIEQWNYAHTLQGYATWVEQQSTTQTSCFQKANSDEQRITCANEAQASLVKQSQKFATTTIPGSMTNAASQMQQAFSALMTATCLSEDASTINNDCLQRLAPSLREIAVLDAHDATQA